MKYLFQLLIALITFSGYSQNGTTSYNLKGDKVKIKADYPSIKIMSSSSDSLELETAVTLNGVKLDDILEVDWDSGSQTLMINSNFKKLDKMSKKELNKMLDDADCEDIKSKWKENMNNWGSYNYNTEVIVRIPNKTKQLYIATTYGSIDVNHSINTMNLVSTYGSVEVHPDASCNECDLESTYGSVSLNTKKGGNSDIVLQSNYGDIYTDIDFDINEEKSTNEMYHSVIVGQLNNGGKRKIHLRSDYSDVYLRGI